MNKFHKLLHEKLTLKNRINVLSSKLSSLINENSSILDVGAGSGFISSNIAQKTNSLIMGIDVLLRPDTLIPVKLFDGKTIPFPDNSFDYVIFIDVLHHTPDPMCLMNEAKRVARKFIIIKDHNCNNWRQKKILCFTDWFGNAQFGVHMEYNFLSRKKWLDIWAKQNLVIEKEIIDFGLYPSYSKIVFWKDMDFISLLSK
jgi:ubiquinone/menaquinone biosynthesis C-methylase UbiE